MVSAEYRFQHMRLRRSYYSDDPWSQVDVPHASNRHTLCAARKCETHSLSWSPLPRTASIVSDSEGGDIKSVPHQVGPVVVFTVKVPEIGLEASPERQVRMFMAAYMPLANHVALVPGIIHVLWQQLPGARKQNHAWREHGGGIIEYLSIRQLSKVSIAWRIWCWPLPVPPQHQEHQHLFRS